MDRKNLRVISNPHVTASASAGKLVAITESNVDVFFKAQEQAPKHLDDHDLIARLADHIARTYYRQLVGERVPAGERMFFGNIYTGRPVRRFMARPDHARFDLELVQVLGEGNDVLLYAICNALTKEPLIVHECLSGSVHILNKAERTHLERVAAHLPSQVQPGMEAQP